MQEKPLCCAENVDAGWAAANDWKLANEGVGVRNTHTTTDTNRAAQSVCPHTLQQEPGTL